LKYADMHGDADLAISALGSVRHDVVQNACPELRAEFALVSACVRGEWDRAASAARDMLSSVSSAKPSDRVAPRLNAAVTLWRCGAPEEAVHALEAAHADAHASGSYRLGLTVAASLSDLSFELDKPTAGLAWIEQARATAARFPEFSTHFSLWVI